MPTESKPIAWSEVRAGIKGLIDTIDRESLLARLDDLVNAIDAAAPAMEQQEKDAAEVAKLRAELCDAYIALSIHSGQRDPAMLTDEHKAGIVRALHESWRRTQAAKAAGGNDVETTRGS